MELPDDHIAKRTVVCRVGGMDAVDVEPNLEWDVNEAGTLLVDIYRPPGPRPKEPMPAVVTVSGYPDPGMQRIFGLRFKEWGSSTSWARLVAASGMVAVNYANREPVADLGLVLDHLRSNGPALGIDPARLGLLACSGHAPLALSALMEAGPERPLRCAALNYPMTLDLDGQTRIAEAAATFRFANPTAGRSVDDLPKETALFISRAGLDEMPGLNDSLGRFVAKALARNLPLTLMNHPEAPHAFDVMHDSEVSREIVRGALTFLRFWLTR